MPMLLISDWRDCGSDEYIIVLLTVLNALDRLQEDFSIKRCVFVGDDGMTSEDNLAQLTAHGYE